jgi:hypothetical protein
VEVNYLNFFIAPFPLNILDPYKSNISTISLWSATVLYPPSFVPVQASASIPPIEVPPTISNIFQTSYFVSSHKVLRTVAGMIPLVPPPSILRPIL